MFSSLPLYIKDGYRGDLDDYLLLSYRNKPGRKKNKLEFHILNFMCWVRQREKEGGMIRINLDDYLLQINEQDRTKHKIDFKFCV